MPCPARTSYEVGARWRETGAASESISFLQLRVNQKLQGGNRHGTKRERERERERKGDIRKFKGTLRIANFTRTLLDRSAESEHLHRKQNSARPNFRGRTQNNSQKGAVFPERNEKTALIKQKRAGSRGEGVVSPAGFNQLTCDWGETEVRGLASPPGVKRRQMETSFSGGGVWGEVPFLQRWRKNLFSGRESEEEWR
jgi:hypothetical protein